MDWIIGMQKAIDYIEEHITEEIDYEMVAQQSFSSSFHFQRVFSILCGYTLGEYIRCRRLSLAGAELANYADLDDILACSCKEKIGRAKYISEDDISEFDGIFKLMNTELKALAQGGGDDV